MIKPVGDCGLSVRGESLARFRQSRNLVASVNCCKCLAQATTIGKNLPLLRVKGKAVLVANPPMRP